jgi:hypothetical protein
MSIFLYFTGHLKKLAKSKIEPLDTLHVNTALTTSCLPKTEIHIFRHEEWYKVFIHETFHNLGLDFSDMDNSDCNRRILEIFPIMENDVRVYESYCETWAEILHVLILSFISTKDKSNGEFIIKKMQKMLKYEIMFSAFQCSKILNHYHMNYNHLVNVNCPISKNARKQYREHTHLLSYYIIKFILISQPSAFIEWCLSNNGSASKKILHFQQTPQNIVNYVELIKTNYLHPSVLRYLKITEEWFHNHTGTNNVESQTLRMTIFS